MTQRMATPRRKADMGVRHDPDEGLEDSLTVEADEALVEYPELQYGARVDPVHTKSSVDTAWSEVVNQRPGMEYCWVPRDTSSRYRYEAMGWAYVRSLAGGPQSRAGGVDPDTGFVTNMDTVLMCMPSKERQRIEAEGWDGKSGLKAVKARESKMDSRNFAEGLKRVVGERDGDNVTYFEFQTHQEGEGERG